MPVIAPLTRDQLDTAATSIARAFASDPLFEWMLPDPADRLRRATPFNRIPLEYALRWGHVMQSDAGRAVALWLPPGPGVTVGRLIRCGMLAAPFHLGFQAFGRFMTANQTMDTLHKRHVPQPHWYLMIVAVDPALHGRGIGTALIQDGLARADREGRACYLETSHERNLALYGRHGFEVLETATLGRGGPTAWAMRRGAATSPASTP